MKIVFFFISSGETAFNAMTIGMGWAKYPMISRIHRLDKNIPISMIYGSRVNYSISELVKEKRKGSYITVKVTHNLKFNNIAFLNLFFCR